MLYLRYALPFRGLLNNKKRNRSENSSRILGQKKMVQPRICLHAKKRASFFRVLVGTTNKTYYCCFCFCFCFFSLIVLRNDTMWGSMFLILQCIVYIVNTRNIAAIWIQSSNISCEIRLLQAFIIKHTRITCFEPLF